MLSFLRHHGVLGLNARNLLYLKPYNPKKAVAFADSKLKTKSYLSARGIPTPNFFTGAHNFHSPCEFLPIPSFELSCRMVLEISRLVSEVE